MLITPPEVKHKVAANTNLDSSKILSAIEVAETRFLQSSSCLGLVAYGTLATEKNRTVDNANLATLQTAFNTQAALTNTPAPQLQVGMMVNASEFLSANSLKLWIDQLWKYTAECVRYMAMGDNYVQFDSAGLIKNNPIGSVVDTSASTSVGADLKDLKYLKDQYLREWIEPLRIALVAYLDQNQGTYPYWQYGSRNETAAKRTAYVDLSIYADQDAGRRGCEWKDNNPQRRQPDSDCCNGSDNWQGW